MPSTHALRTVGLRASHPRLPISPASVRLASTFPTGHAPSHEQQLQPSSSGDGVSPRLRAIKLYKELHRLGRDYPDPNYNFNARLRRAFEKNARTTDPAELNKQLELAEHIKKEVLQLISLKKFRHLRRTYYPGDGPR